MNIGFANHCVRLELFSNGKVIGTGTGIVASKMGKKIILTALHVLTGRKYDPDSNKWQPVHKTGAVPQICRVTGHEDVQIALTGEHNVNYWRHPKGPKIDVAILPWKGIPRH